MFEQKGKMWDNFYEGRETTEPGYVREGWMGITKNCLNELASLFDHVLVTYGKRKVEVMQMGIADDDYLSFSAIDILKRMQEEAADEDRASIPQAAFAFTEFVEPLNPRHMEIAASLICTIVYERALGFQEREHLMSLTEEAKQKREMEVRKLTMELGYTDAVKVIDKKDDEKKEENYGDTKNDYPGHHLKEKFDSIDAKWLPTFVVSIGNRGAGALAHAVASYLHLPYSLTNWYPDGSEGEVRVDRCAGIGGPGWVYLNGVPPNSRVLVVLDAIHTGRNAQHVVEAVQKISECVVWGVYIVCEIADGNAKERICQSLQDGVPVVSLIRVNLGTSNNNDNVTSYTKIKTVEVKPAVRKWLYELYNLEGKKVNIDEKHKELYERTKDLSKCKFEVVPDENYKINKEPEKFEVYLNRLLKEEPKDVVIGTRCVLPRRYVSSYTSLLKRMYIKAIEQKMNSVTSAFVNVPIVVNDKVAYPYCYFALTDFKPALQPELVEDMADLCIYYSNLHECDVLVSEGDRGGGPLLQAISIRVNKPYVIASWTVDETETSTTSEDSVNNKNNENSSVDTSDNNDNNKHSENETSTERCEKTSDDCSKKSTACSAVTSVGFSGNCNRLCLRGLKPNMRCAFVDDMLSSGGTADAVLHCIEELGAIAEEAVFISEKLYPTEKENSSQHDNLPTTIAPEENNALNKCKLLRKGQRRLHNLFPHTKITTVIQFVVEGSCTSFPKERVGPFTCVNESQVKEAKNKV